MVEVNLLIIFLIFAIFSALFGLEITLVSITLTMLYKCTYTCNKKESFTPELTKKIVQEERELPREITNIDPEVEISNGALLSDIMAPKLHTADDKAAVLSVESGLKNKKAKEIRSHWNNNNWKKYYTNEFMTHDIPGGEWWGEDDFELSKKHTLV